MSDRDGRLAVSVSSIIDKTCLIIIVTRDATSGVDKILTNTPRRLPHAREVLIPLFLNSSHQEGPRNLSRAQRQFFSTRNGEPTFLMNPLDITATLLHY